MADLPYGQFDMRLGQLCIEDVAYDWAPSQFARVEGSELLRGESVKTLDLSRKVVIPKNVNFESWYGYTDGNAIYDAGASATNYHVNPRYVVQQSWRLTWEDAYVDLCLRDHLYTLHSLQKTFWVQFDDEMSYDCVSLEPVSVDRTSFITPTYPIAFSRVSDANGTKQIEHAYLEVSIDGLPTKWDDNPWRLDPTIGLLNFQNAIPEASIVSVRYLWRAYVRIAEIEFSIVNFAQGAYSGHVVLEEVPIPNDIERFDDKMVVPPCRRGSDNKYIDGSDASICTGLIYPVVAESKSRTGGTWDWVNTQNVTASDNAMASATCTSMTTPKFQHLYASQFNFNTLPDDGNLNRTITEICVEIAGITDTGSVYVDDVRVTLNGVSLGRNAASQEIIGSANEVVKTFVIDPDGYGITYEDVLRSRIGVAIGLTAVSNCTVNIDSIVMSVCYETGVSDTLPVVDCTCGNVDLPGTPNTYLASGTSLHWYENVAGFSIPAGSYIHGVTIQQLKVGTTTGCALAATAAVKARLRLNDANGTFSTWRTKNDVPVAVKDLAIYGVADTTGTTEFGTTNDLWGKPFGAWTPALVNANGLQFDLNWDTSSDPQDSANWQVQTVFDGYTETSVGNPGDPVRTTWGQILLSDWRYEYIGSGNPCYIHMVGTITTNYTWVGSGDAPSTVTINVTSKAKVHCSGDSEGGTWEGSVDNGLGADVTTTYTGGYVSQLYSDSAREVSLSLKDGVATYTTAVDLYSNKPQVSSPNSKVYAGVKVASELATASSPVRKSAIVRMYYSPSCETNALCHGSADETGSWNRPTYKGLGCELAQTSDGTVSGAYALDMYGYALELFNANTRIVGILFSGSYRYVGSVPISDITIKSHIGSYDASRVGKVLAHPTSTEWTTFSVGANGDFWDYGTVYVETGVTVPTALGSHVNSYFHMQLLGTNELSKFVEFKDLKVTLFFAAVCDGL